MLEALSTCCLPGCTPREPQAASSLPRAGSGAGPLLVLPLSPLAGPAVVLSS